MSVRVLKQYIELYQLSGSIDYFLETSKDKEVCIEANNVYQTQIVDPFKQLKIECEQCDKCRYRKDRGGQKVVFGSGHFSSKCFVVGDPVNVDENLSGHPFGRSNNNKYHDMFNNIIKKGLIEGENLQMTFSDLYLTNITKCRAHKRDNEEIQKCLFFLLKQIEIIKPMIILVFGEYAANAIFNSSDHINYYRENQGLKFHNIPVYFTLNPMDIVRLENDKENYTKMKKIVMNDLKFFAKAYREL